MFFGGKADIAPRREMSASGPDIGFSIANLRLWPKAHIGAEKVLAYKP